MRTLAIRSLTPCLIFSVASIVDASPPMAPQAAPLEALRACRVIVDDARRAACYDSATDDLLNAQAKRDVIVIDRESARKAKRSLFGLAVPDLKIFDGPEPAGRKALVEDNKLDTMLVRSEVDPYGRFVFVLEGGQRWHQIDDNPISQRLHPGDSVTVYRAALGSYKLSVKTGSAVRVHREN